jgi:hypothetical protein
MKRLAQTPILKTYLLFWQRYASNILYENLHTICLPTPYAPGPGGKPADIP